MGARPLQGYTLAWLLSAKMATAAAEVCPKPNLKRSVSPNNIYFGGAWQNNNQLLFGQTVCCMHPRACRATQRFLVFRFHLLKNHIDQTSKYNLRCFNHPHLILIKKWIHRYIFIYLSLLTYIYICICILLTTTKPNQWICECHLEHDVEPYHKIWWSKKMSCYFTQSNLSTQDVIGTMMGI